MADDRYTFEQARIRLEEIAGEVRKKDTSLEKSLDLLEEGVRLANICTELVDHTDVSARVAVPEANGTLDEAPSEDAGSTAPGVADAEEASVEPSSEENEPVAEGADEMSGEDGFDEADEALGENAEADAEA